jgi:hypothetical protein
MEIRLDLVGIVVRDMRASLEFYRRLGLDIPGGAEDEPHAEATTPSGSHQHFSLSAPCIRSWPIFSSECSIRTTPMPLHISMAYIPERRAPPHSTMHKALGALCTTSPQFSANKKLTG